VTIHHSGWEKQQVIFSTISLRPRQPNIGIRAIGGLWPFFICRQNIPAGYDSPAYEAIKPIRQSSAKSRMFIVEGIAPQ
jgi:hypothetical protein